MIVITLIAMNVVLMAVILLLFLMFTGHLVQHGVLNAQEKTLRDEHEEAHRAQDVQMKDVAEHAEAAHTVSSELLRATKAMSVQLDRVEGRTT